MKRIPKDTTKMQSRKITAAEAEALMPHDGRTHWLTPFLTSLAVGEAFHLVRSDWTWRSRGPGLLVSRMGKAQGMRFKVQVCSDGSGWVITRSA